VVKASLEVRSGTARFRVAVSAQSIERAVSLVGGRYPKCDVKVIFPIEPEAFFVVDPAAQAGMTGMGQLDGLAAR
jgi:hypothetical protein